MTGLHVVLVRMMYLVHLLSHHGRSCLAHAHTQRQKLVPGLMVDLTSQDSQHEGSIGL